MQRATPNRSSLTSSQNAENRSFHQDNDDDDEDELEQEFDDEEKQNVNENNNESENDQQQEENDEQELDEENDNNQNNHSNNDNDNDNEEIDDNEDDDDDNNNNNDGESDSPAPQSTSNDPNDSSSNYSQYMARNRSRYSYSPTPASPNPVKTPSSSHSNTLTTQMKSSIQSRSPTLAITVNNSNNHQQQKDESSPSPSPSPQSEISNKSPSSSSQRLRSHSLLASPSSPSSALNYYKSELLKAQSLISERENDLKLAAQIGETLMEENERFEELLIKMKDDLQQREENEAAKNKEIAKQKKIIEELKKQNSQLINNQNTNQTNNSNNNNNNNNNNDNFTNISKNKPPPLMSPVAAQSVQDFLRQELSATNNSNNSDVVYHDEYTGDLTVDIRSFARRINSERRSNLLIIGTLRESVARFEESIAEKSNQIILLSDQLKSSRSREELFQSKLTELSDRQRQNEIETINEKQRELITNKKNNERIIQELKNLILEEKQEKEQQIKLRILAEENIQTIKKQNENLKFELEEANNKIKENEKIITTTKTTTPITKKKIKKKRETLNNTQSINNNNDSVSKTIHLTSEFYNENDSNINDSNHVESLPTSTSDIPDDTEHRELLEQLHTYVSDVRQQLTQFRVDEEKKGRINEDNNSQSESNSGIQTPNQLEEKSPTSPIDNKSSNQNDEEDAKLMAIERAKLLEASSEREQLKARAKEKRAKAAAAKSAMEAARIEAQQRAAELEQQQKELQEKYRLEEEEKENNRRPKPIMTINSETTRANRNDDDVSSSTTMSEDNNNNNNNNNDLLILSSNSSIPSSINPAIVIPGSSTFTHTPNFTRPNFEFSAIDHFTLTHIQLLLSQMWAIALSLLSASPTQTPAWYDNKHPACLLCHHKFGLLTRRHHCRLCGGLVCSACSNHKVTIEKFNYKNARVCNTCFVMASTVGLCRKAVESGQVEYSQIIKEAEKFAENERIKANKEIRAIETPRGSTLLQAVKSDENPSSIRKTSETNVSPALVPYFAAIEGDINDSSPINTITNLGSTPPRTDRMMAMIQAEKAKQQQQQSSSQSTSSSPLPPSHPSTVKKSRFWNREDKTKKALSGQAIL